MKKPFKKTKEQRFWAWFSQIEKQAHTDFKDTKKREQFFDALRFEFDKINKELTFEFGGLGGDSGSERIEFAISADGIKSAFPDVIKLYKAAPSLARWDIVAFRQRHENAESFRLRCDDYEIACDDVYFLYATDENDSEELLHLQFHVRNYAENRKWAVFILLDSLLGEYDAEMSIGSIEWVDLKEDNLENLSPLVALRDLVDKRSTRRNTVN